MADSGNHVAASTLPALSTSPANRVIPGATFVPVTDPTHDQTGQAPPSQLNAVAQSSLTSRVLAAARDSVIPLVYGGPQELAGKLYLARVYQGDLLFVLLLCEGPINSVVNFTLNDVAWPNDLALPTIYLGTQSQTVDATLAAAISGFNEALTGTAYLVIRIPRGHSQGFPRVKCQVNGIKVYDPRGNAVQLTGGTGQFVSVPATANLNSLNAHSITAWIYHTSSDTNGGIFEKTIAGANASHFYLIKEGSNFTYGVKPAAAAFKTISTPVAGFEDAWHHVGGTYDGQVMSLYVDGALMASYDFGTPTTLASGSGVSAIGKSFATGYEFAGTIDEVRVWNFARTQAQINSNMRTKLIGTESGLVGYWRFDEGTGTSAADSSASANTATLTGGPTWTAGFGLGPSTSPTLAWSDNPALCLADFLSSVTYGARKTMDWNSVAQCADYDDALVGSPAEKRNLISLTLGAKQKVHDWVNSLRSYVPCWVTDINGLCTLIPDSPRATDHTFGANEIDQNPLPTIIKRGIADVPNVIQIGYTRTDVTPWATAYAEAVYGSPSTRRISRVEFPGITRFSQAMRFATERLNHYNIENLEAAFGIFDYGLRVTLGDICSVTDDIGLSSKLFRTLKVTDLQHGRWKLDLRAYDPAAYDNSVHTAAATPDTGLPDPKVVAAPTGLVITETVYLEKDPSVAGSIALGLVYQSRFDLTWTAPVHAYPFTYRIEIYDGSTTPPTKIQEGTTSAPAFSTPAVQQGKTYNVKVYTRNVLGYESTTPLSGSQVALGKLLKPQPVPAITLAAQANGEIFLVWQPAVDIDVIRYEWRYTPNQTAGGTWEGATFIDRIDGLRARFKGLVVGTHRFYVRPIDSVGQYSTSDTTVDITVTSDADAFLVSREFTSPTLTNMVALPQKEGEWKLRWATSFATDAFNTVEPNPFNSGGNPVISYHASGTSKFVGESWDLGSTISGDFTLTTNETDITGTATFSMETSPDGATWTAQTGISFKGSTRFIRPVLQTATTGTMLIFAPPKITLAAVTAHESGQVTTLSSGAKLVQLANKYTTAQDLQATAINTTASRTVVADRLLLYPQTGLMLNFDKTSGHSDKYLYQKIATISRTILSDDFVEFDTWIDSNNAAVSGNSDGGLDIHFTDTTYASAGTFNDADGYAGAKPATGFDALARGLWKSRKIALSTFAGKVVDFVDIVAESDAQATNQKVIYRNIRFTNGSGTDRQTIWTGGEPSANTVDKSQDIANGKCGPTNSFNLYAFDGSNTQVAQDARWAFDGF